MNLRLLTSGTAIACLLWIRPSIREDASEEIRASYLEFVERVNALSNSVTTDMWSPEAIGRLKVLESDSVNEHFRAFKVAGATISVDGIDVVFQESHRAIVVVKRALNLRQTNGASGETTRDSILAMMNGPKKGHWCVAYQAPMSQEEKFEHESPNTSASQVAARAAFERIVNGMTTGDRRAVDAAVSTRSGRTLSGEVGRYLLDSKQRKIDCEDLRAVAWSDQTCVFQGEIYSFEEISGSTNRAGTERGGTSILVFRRAADDSWRLDGELVYPN